MAKTATKSTKSTAQKQAIGVAMSNKKSPQQAAAKALSTALANVARVVLVNFAGNDANCSYYTRDESIVEGDYCIVIIPFSDRYGFHNAQLNGYPSIVKVLSAKETVQSVSAASKWIVQKLDLTAAIAEANKRERISVLETKIKKARKAAEERIKLDQLRELSPELNDLINELDSLI